MVKYRHAFLEGIRRIIGKPTAEQLDTIDDILARKLPLNMAAVALAQALLDADPYRIAEHVPAFRHALKTGVYSGG